MDTDAIIQRKLHPVGHVKSNQWRHLIISQDGCLTKCPQNVFEELFAIFLKWIEIQTVFS